VISVVSLQMLGSFYANNWFVQITGRRLTGLFSSCVNGFGLGF